MHCLIFYLETKHLSELTQNSPFYSVLEADTNFMNVDRAYPQCPLYFHYILSMIVNIFVFLSPSRQKSLTSPVSLGCTPLNKFSIEIHINLKVKHHPFAPCIREGGNSQLSISPLLKCEGWLYNVMDSKNFEINSQEPPCTGGLRNLHAPIETCRKYKNMKIWILF